MGSDNDVDSRNRRTLLPHAGNEAARILSSFWIGYLLGVSQNIVAALIWGPWLLNKIKTHLDLHHLRILRALKHEPTDTPS